MSLQFTGSSQESLRQKVRYSGGLKISNDSSFACTKLKTLSVLKKGGKVCEQSPDYLRDLGALLFCKDMLNI